MTEESLRALLIDRELGELTPEAADLLQSWLADHPGSNAELAQVRETLQIARETVRRFPDLGRPEPTVTSIPRASFRALPLALAASVAVLLALSGWIGFQAGLASAPVGVVEKTQIQPDPIRPPERGPWTKYALVSSPQGGLTVVRTEDN